MNPPTLDHVLNLAVLGVDLAVRGVDAPGLAVYLTVLGADVAVLAVALAVVWPFWP